MNFNTVQGGGGGGETNPKSRNEKILLELEENHSLQMHIKYISAMLETEHTII